MMLNLLIFLLGILVGMGPNITFTAAAKETGFRSRLDDVDEVEVAEIPNEYHLLWDGKLFIIGPEAGGWVEDNKYTGEYLCARLKLLLYCECSVLGEVRIVQASCPGNYHVGRIKWFAEKHNLQILHNTVYTIKTDDKPLDYEIAASESSLLDDPENLNELAWNIDILDSSIDDNLEIGYTGEGVHLFIFDTGFTLSYARTDDFPNGVKLAPMDQHWHPGSDEHDAFFDCNGHGTQVTFLAGGKFRSVAPDVTVHVVRISSCEGCREPARCEGGGTSYSSYTFRAVNWVIETVKREGIKKAIVSRSFSTSKPDSATYKSYSRAAQALAENDILWVASAGNTNSTRCVEDYCKTLEDPTIICPQTNGPNETYFDVNALIVGALDPSGSKASYSSWGSCVTQWMYGSEILGVPPPSAQDPPPPNSPQYSAFELRGTSFATPLAAGIGALFLEASKYVVSVEDLKRAVNGTMAIVGEMPPNHASGFEVTYDLDNVTELSLVGTGGDKDDGRFYYCAPNTERKMVFMISKCFFKNEDACIDAASYCSWVSVPGTVCQARSKRYFALYNVLCKTIPNACRLFSSFLCVDPTVEKWIE